MTETATGPLVDVRVGVDFSPGRTPASTQLDEADAAPDAASPPRRKRRAPARLRIMAWVMLLMLSVLLIVNLATRQELINDVEDGVRDALAQEAEEFVGVAAGGINRSTEQPYSGIEELLDSHLQRQFPDDDEVVVGVLPDGRILRQVRNEPISLADRPDLVREIVADQADSGSAPTDDGELRWRKVSVRDDGPGTAAGTFIIGYDIDRDRADVTETMRALVAVSVIGLLLAGVGAFLVSGRTSPRYASSGRPRQRSTSRT